MFGRLVNRLGHPLLIVTAEASGGRAGCLLCFATKGNLDPPRFLLCLPRRNRTFRVAA
jgi:flavin reductase (DIM6/NTAB) family NADH-FMN oxidoreductase RutF